MGEGAASLIVEELEHARARGARIYAEVLGYSLNNDAFHMTSPLPTGESCIRAIRDALADAQLKPEQIDYINAHASSTQLNDSAETKSIRNVFGEHANRVPVSGTKGYYAHPLGATGAIEAALCALALDRQWIPPTINYQNPDSACDLGVVPNQGREAKLNYIMSNSFGFGGLTPASCSAKFPKSLRLILAVSPAGFREFAVGLPLFSKPRSPHDSQRVISQAPSIPEIQPVAYIAGLQAIRH